MKAGTLGKTSVAVMAALVLVAAAMVLAGGPGLAAGPWTFTSVAKPASVSLTAGCALDTSHVWAGGASGTIVFYNGSSWATQTIPSLTPVPFIGGLAAADSSHIWAAGDNTDILFSDGTAGGNWVTQNVGPNPAPSNPVNFSGAYALSTSSVWVVGGTKNTPYTSAIWHYNGASWADETPVGMADQLKAVSGYDADHVWAVGVDASGNGHVYFRDSSHTWNTTTQYTVAGPGATLRGICAIDSTHVWAVGDGGVILFYNGTSWSQHLQSKVITTNGLYMVNAKDADHVWAAGSSDTILVFNGTAWTLYNSGMGTANHRTVVAGSLSNVWVTGQSGNTFSGTVPSIASCNPTTAGQGKTEGVDIVGSGTHFSQGTSAVSVSGSGITINSTTVTDATHLSVNITTAPGATLGARDVNVSTGAESPEPLAGGLTVVTTPTHIIKASAGANGSIDPSGDVTVNEGSDQTFTITPAEHYVVGDVLVDGASVGAVSSHTFHAVDQDHTISAVFSNKTHVIQAWAIGNGAIDPSGSVTVNDGTDKTFYFIPDPHYHVQNVYVDNHPVDWDAAAREKSSKVQPSGSYAFVNVTDDHTIAVSFAIDTFNVDASVSGGHGRVDRAGQLVDYGGTATINITPDPYYHINSVTDNGTPQAASTPYVINNVTEAHDVVVTFAQTPPGVNSVSPKEGKPGEQVTINGSDFGKSQGSSTVTVGGVIADVVSWSDTKIVITVPAGATSGAILVSTPGGVGGAAFPVYFPTWYLAEGSTAWGFNTTINIENPNANEVTARISYFDTQYPLGKGTVKTRDVKLPAASQTVVNANDDLGYAVDFSTRVDCLEGQTIAVDRTMSWSSGMGEARGIHNSIGVTTPDTTWYLPEGSSAWGFECWTLIENPGAKDAEVTLTYMVEGKGPQPVKHRVPAYSRATYNMEDDIGAADASIEVTSDVPVIPERSMYCYWTPPQSGESVRREGSNSIGTTTPSTDFYLAEGTTAWGFTTYVLVQNPNKKAATVTITYNTSSGAISTDPFTMPAESRKTVRVNDVLPNRDLSTHVHANVPIIAERSMYWSSDLGAGQGMHDSIGVPGPHMIWYLPDGYTSTDDNGTETYTLVQNPSDFDVQIRVSYLTRSGKGNVTFTDTVKANSRKTYVMGDKISDKGASVLVECLLAQPTLAGVRVLPGVIVERSMYYGGRWSGTDTIGAFDDLMLR